MTYGGQTLINNADNLKPVSHFLGLDQLRPSVLGNVPAAPAPVVEEPSIQEVAPRADSASDLLPADTEAALDVAPAEPAAAPEPVIAQSPPPVVNDDAKTKTEITEMVSNWAAAWSARDVEGYLSFYSSRFELPGQLSRSEWESQRRARIVGKKNIEVEISNLNIQPNGDEATVEFDQAYRADSYNDRVVKTLRLVQENDRWRIVTEQSN